MQIRANHWQIDKQLVMAIAGGIAAALLLCFTNPAIMAAALGAVVVVIAVFASDRSRLLLLGLVTASWGVQLGDGLPATIMMTLVVAVRSIKAWINCHQIKLGWPEFFLILFIALNWFSAFPNAQLDSFKPLLKLTLGMMIFLLALDSSKEWLGTEPEKLIRMVVVSGTIFTAALVFINIFIWHSPFLTANFLNSASGAGKNQLAFYLANLYGITYLMNIKRPKQLIWIRLIIFLAIVYTQSRGALVAVLLATGFYWCLKLWYKQIRISRPLMIKIFLLTLIVVLVPAIVIISSPPEEKEALVERLQVFDAITRSYDSGSVGARKYLLSLGLDLFAERPFFGHGINAFYANSIWMGMRYLSHNDYIQILVEQGLTGLILLAGFVLAMLGRILRARAKNGSHLGAVVTLLIPIVYLLFINAIQTPLIWFVFALIQGVVRNGEGQIQGSHSYNAI